MQTPPLLAEAWYTSGSLYWKEQGWAWVYQRKKWRVGEREVLISLLRLIIWCRRGRILVRETGVQCLWQSESASFPWTLPGEESRGLFCCDPMRRKPAKCWRQGRIAKWWHWNCSGLGHRCNYLSNSNLDKPMVEGLSIRYVEGLPWTQVDI